MPRFMVIERFKSGQSGPVYARYHEKGRMLPEGLRYIDSWLSADDDVCYQLMETQTPETFDSWIANWDDLVNFEVIKLKEKPTGRQR
ncbi:DUF3303 domain-containing protein [Roseovarius rhodophyticola]|uniref:DUF3303 family protein n=1 Tax=Roseovarius rhodophyticola TaxID=3080827 RepID=A0ABZ2TJF4_9RHOB|nr:DUF3303 family protein [Roseovarius sp. W115]MDV2928477.1 DUF3303 family protein [Roseovarius sp. W115]